MSESVVSVFGVTDYVVMCSMLVFSAAIGVFYAVRAGSGAERESSTDFLMGGRSLSTFPVSMSVLASFMSAITLLGTPAEMYQYGTLYWMVNLCFLMVIPATAYCYIPVFHRLELTSVYEYLELRFSRVLRTMGAVIFTIHMLMYLPVVLYAPSLALSQVTGLSVIFSVLSIGIVCTFYTSIGGIKAVVWTDLFQTLLMFASMFVITFKGAADEGGMASVWRKNEQGQRVEFFNFDPDPTVRHTVWGLAIGGYFTWMGNYAVNQAMVQRYLTLPTVGAAQRCTWITMPGMWLLITISCLSGMVVYGRYHDCDPASVGRVQSPDQLFPMFVMDSLGNTPGLPGFFVAGVFSGALSTISSGVNSLAAVTLEDMVKNHFNKNISELWATRLTKIIALTYGLLSIALVAVAALLGDVLQVGMTIHGIVGGPMLGVYTLGMFFPWTNTWGAGVGLLFGFGVAFWVGLGSLANRTPALKAPVSVDGCLDLYRNFTGSAGLPVTSRNATTPVEDVFYGYRLSYLWYSAIGFLAVLIVGVVVSFLTGRQDPKEVDARLITPFMRSIYAKFNVQLGQKFREKNNEIRFTAHFQELETIKERKLSSQMVPTEITFMSSTRNTNTHLNSKTVINTLD